MNAVTRFCDWGMVKLRSFSVLEVGVFKSCILSAGMLLASYCAKGVRRLRPILWVVALGSYAYLIWRMVFHDEA